MPIVYILWIQRTQVCINKYRKIIKRRKINDAVKTTKKRENTIFVHDYKKKKKKRRKIIIINDYIRSQINSNPRNAMAQEFGGLTRFQ